MGVAASSGRRLLLRSCCLQQGTRTVRHGAEANEAHANRQKERVLEIPRSG